MATKTRTRRFRELIEADEILVQPGIYDQISAPDIALVAREVNKPRPITPLTCAREMPDLGVALVGYPRLVTEAAIRRMENALSVLLQSAAEGRVIEQPDLVAPFEEPNELMAFSIVRDKQQRFLAAAQRETKYGASR